MKKYCRIFLVLLLIFTVTACNKSSPNTGSSLSFGSINSSSDFENSSNENVDSNNSLSSVESTPSSNVVSTTTSNKPSSQVSHNTSNNNTTSPKPQPNPSQNITSSIVKKQAKLYSQVNGSNVVQATFDYTEGETWAKIVERNPSITQDTTFDINFNEIEYLKYNGKAILRNDRPVQTDDVVSADPVYRLGIIAGPAKIQTTTMYDLINVEHAHDGGSGGKKWDVRRYVITETSKTTGTIAVDSITVVEYSQPNEPFNGTIITNNRKPIVYTYTSDYGLYPGKTIKVSDGSTIFLSNDLYWFYKEGSARRILCNDYRAYKNVPNNLEDKYWDYFWSQF